MSAPLVARPASRLESLCARRRSGGASSTRSPLTSFAVASYAVLQRLGLDPVPWTDAGPRTGSTLGNPLFLAAWLGLVFFLSVRELALRTLPPLRAVAAADRPGFDPLADGFLAYNLVLQIVAVLLSQSRGPLLGILAGSSLGLLTLLLDARSGAGAMTPGSRLAPRLGSSDHEGPADRVGKAHLQGEHTGRALCL